MSQHELARRSGIAQPSIARIEAGRVVPRVDTLDRLLEPLGEALEAVPRLGQGVDRSVIREMLRLTPTERAELARREAAALARTGA